VGNQEQDIHEARKDEEDFGRQSSSRIIEHRQNAWLFQNPRNNYHPRGEDAITFISILQLLAKSPMPPNELDIEVVSYPMENPILVVEEFMFFLM